MKLKDLVVRRLESIRPAGARSPRARRRSAWFPEALEPRTLLAASLVKDLNATDVTISAMLGVGAKEYFAARNGSGTVDLFVSDGTALGTSKLASFALTSSTSLPLSNLTSVGPLVYFTVNQGNNGLALWKTDGTSGGTLKVKDVPPQGGQGASTWYPSSLTAVGNKLYFIANDGVTGSEIWTSNGTTAGTVALDAVPGIQGLNPTPGTLFGVGSTLYASASNHLYKYDGTTQAPVAVPGAPGAASGTLAAIGTKLFYTASGQPYALDTTTNTPISLGVRTVFNTLGETVVGSKLFFLTQDSLTAGLQFWSSDGTAAGTTAFTAPTSFSTVSVGVAAGDSYVFTMDDGSGPALWKSDGTVAGTVALTAGGSRITNPSFLTVSGTRVYYTRPGGAGPALWMTETAPGGTSLQLLDLTPFTGGGTLRLTSGSGGALYAAFTQTPDGIGRLVRSDGTIAGSGVFREFTPAATLNGNPRQSIAIGPNQLLFMANDTTGNDGLWVSDGTTAGTSLLQSFGSSFALTSASPTLFNGRAYFLVKQANYSSTNVGLWSSDGASASLVAPIDRLQGADSMVVFNGSLYFNTTPDGKFQPTQLRKSDGTAAGTSVLQTFNLVTDLVDGGSRLYLTADSGPGARLWALAAGGSTASQVVDAGGNPLLQPSRVTMVGQTPFVVAGANGARRLYRINPTTGVASVVTDTGTNPVAVSDSSYLAAMGSSSLVFNGLSGGLPVLWVVNTAGPAGLVTIGGQSVANPGQPVTLGSSAYFAADGASGRELYKFDGAAASLVKDVNSGVGGSNPSNLTVVGSTLVFLADDGTNGVEPWISNGTSAGTVLAANIAPGSAGVYAGPSGLVLGQVNGRVLLALSDGSRGVEPWAMVVNAPTNTAPTLDPIANQQVLVNQTLSFRAVGSDIDAGQTLTYSLVNAPAGAQVNPTTGIFTWVPTIGGNYTLTVKVTDSGNPALSASQAVNVTVNSNTTPPPAQSTTTLGLSSTSITVGQPVTFTATIGGGGASPGGSVTFVNGGTVLGSALVNGTTAAFTTSSLAIGGYAVQAIYSGTTGVLGSSSNVVNLNVGDTATSIALTPPGASVSVGQSIAIAVNVTSSGGTPTGSVTVFIDGGWPEIADLVNGVGVATFVNVQPGNHTFTATYHPTGNWAPSEVTSGPTVSVQALPTSTSLAISASTIGVGQPVTLTANVGSNSGTPNGTVTFLINGGWPVTVNVVNGVATTTRSDLSAGNYTFTALYNAADDWAASSSGTQALTVADLTTTILAGPAGIAVRPRGNGFATVTLTTSKALNTSSALNAANYTLYVGRKVKVGRRMTIVYDRAVRPTVKYAAGGTTITLTPPGGRLAIPAGVNAKLVVNGLVDNQNRAVTPYAVFFNKRGLVGVTTASVVRVPAGPAALRR